MSGRLIAVFAAILVLGYITVMALMNGGVAGIVVPHFQSWGAGQVFADLVISLLICLFFISKDAPTRGLPFWPFLVLTLALGSFGPLAYLVMRELRAPAA